jgi:hypothetical protein
MAAATENGCGVRRQRAHTDSATLIVRHDGSASPQLAQQGGTKASIANQHDAQTAPRVGSSSGSRHAAQTGAINSASAASESARVITAQLRIYLLEFLGLISSSSW